MAYPNRNTLWATAFVDELAKGGVDTVCLSPGSRSTPLTLAFAAHPAIETFSHLDERSGAFFALGRSRRTGQPTPVVCTSGTAAANFHPAVLEASESRVPLLLLTADRPPELRDSGANQTTDQTELYGDAVRWYRQLPEPEADARKLRSLRVTAARALANAMGTPPGPVHLNVPFRKPLEPTPVSGDVPADLSDRAPLGTDGRSGAFVETVQGQPELDSSELRAIASAIDDAGRGLIVCGPGNQPTPSPDALSRLARTTGYPVLADPLSGHRFSESVTDCLICGGYDAYLDGCDWPEPDIVVRFGLSPTSKVLRKYLAGVESRQFVIDAAGGWPEAEFTSTDLLVAEPTRFATSLAEMVSSPADSAYSERFERAEQRYWALVSEACEARFFEGGVLAAVAEHLPERSTLFVSNSMPVRDLDRFGRPRPEPVTILGNRGVSGIDGIISTGLGAGSASDEPLILVTGDLAFYHDMNGLLALSRCDVEATIVLVDNDGGGIFHKLPIEAFDPPFTEQFRTPHGLDFSVTGELYDFEFERLETRAEFVDAFTDSVGRDGSQVLAVEFDAESSHRYRETIQERVVTEMGG